MLTLALKIILSYSLWRYITNVYFGSKTQRVGLSNSVDKFSLTSYIDQFQNMVSRYYIEYQWILASLKTAKFKVFLTGKDGGPFPCDFLYLNLLS